MNWDSDRFKLFTRRAAILGGIKGLLVSSLIGRMYYLQVVERERYRTLAEENRINFRLLPPPRGRILDRFGRVLANNQQNYRVVVVSEQTNDITATLDALGTIITISAGERRRILREIGRKRRFVPITVRENLSWPEVAQIEVNMPDLPGAMIEVGESRFYADGEAMAHFMGYVSAVSENEQTGDPLLELPGFRIGKAGVEKVYDLSLRGTAGTSQIEVNAVGRVIREVARQDGQPGSELRLTIDMELQRFVSQRLTEGPEGSNTSAAAVVLDALNGDVLAMNSNPSYDPNAFNQGLSGVQWASLLNNPRTPLINKAIAGQYAPGSTVKMLVALAALEKGVISADQKVFCPGYMQLGNARFHCWKRPGHGWVNMHEAIKGSCDVYFYEISKRVGIDRIADMARRFGLGETQGLDLPGEKPGLVPTRGWKQAVYGVPWQKGETLITGIGQGFMLTTPLQLATMVARIGNGGLAVRPRLVRPADRSRIIVPGNGEPDRSETSDGDTQNIERVQVSSAHLAIVRRAMEAVSNDPRGTAYRSRIDKAGMELAGKTGTAQVRRISKSERESGVRKNKDMDWKFRDHALFVAYAPIHAPRYAVSVLVEHGGSGSRAAAPIARDILRMAQERESARERLDENLLGSRQPPIREDSS